MTAWQRSKIDKTATTCSRTKRPYNEYAVTSRVRDFLSRLSNFTLSESWDRGRLRRRCEDCFFLQKLFQRRLTGISQLYDLEKSNQARAQSRSSARLYSAQERGHKNRLLIADNYVKCCDKYTGAKWVMLDAYCCFIHRQPPYRSEKCVLGESASPFDEGSPRARVFDRFR